jgi:hypothetical protein
MFLSGTYLKISAQNYGNFIGPLATIGRKPRQIRKEATVATDLCAGVWLVKSPPLPIHYKFNPRKK